MAATEVTIANMALSMLGVTNQLTGATIASNSGSLEGQQAAIWYENSRKWAYRDYPWSIGLRIAALTLVEFFDTADDEYGMWAYSYRRPTSAMLIRAVRFPLESRTLSPPNKWEESADATGGLILTDVGTSDLGGGLCEYMIDVSDTTLFDAKFEAALAGLLAYRLAPGLSADPQKARDAFAAYIAEKLSAQRTDANEMETGEEPDGSFVTTHRGG